MIQHPILEQKQFKNDEISWCEEGHVSRDERRYLNMTQHPILEQKQFKNNRKPGFRDDFCPICHMPCVSMYTENDEISWCEEGHVCRVDSSNGLEIIYEFNNGGV